MLGAADQMHQVGSAVGTAGTAARTPCTGGGTLALGARSVGLSMADGNAMPCRAIVGLQAGGRALVAASLPPPRNHCVVEQRATRRQSNTEENATRPPPQSRTARRQTGWRGAATPGCSPPQTRAAGRAAGSPAGMGNKAFVHSGQEPAAMLCDIVVQVGCRQCEIASLPCRLLPSPHSSFRSTPHLPPHSLHKVGALLWIQRAGQHYHAQTRWVAQQQSLCMVRACGSSKGHERSGCPRGKLLPSFIQQYVVARQALRAGI